MGTINLHNVTCQTYPIKIKIDLQNYSFRIFLGLLINRPSDHSPNFIWTIPISGQNGICETKVKIFSSITSRVKFKTFQTSPGTVKIPMRTHNAMCFIVVIPTCCSERAMTQKTKSFDGVWLALRGGLFRPGLKFMW